MLQLYEFIRANRKSVSKFDPSATNISKEIVEKLEELWAKANIPTISYRSITKSVLKLVSKLLYFRKRERINKNSKPLLNEINEFKAKFDKLFELAACKCDTYNNCVCPKEKKMSERVFDFLQDQRCSRNQSIDEIECENICSVFEQDIEDYCEEQPPGKKIIF